MANIPARLKAFLPLKLLNQGKVRDTYELPGYPNLILVVASDRLSIFDFVLNTLVPAKGEVLNAFNIFWKTQCLPRFLGDTFSHDLFAHGAAIDKFLPAEMCGNEELHKRAVIVQKLHMDSIEHIVRGYLTGSGWDAYRTTTPPTICGHVLPEGLYDGSELPYPIYTPTTKAAVGHDEHMDVTVARRQFPGAEGCVTRIYSAGQEYARSRGIIVADTKMETGRRSPQHVNGFILADEVLTPDSSRFWDLEEWERLRAERKSPTPWDKQVVRNWGKAAGIHRCRPQIEEDVEWVHKQVVPESVVAETSATYFAIFKRLTGLTLPEFQNRFLLA